MRDADFWQDLDRTDSTSVALLGGLLAFVAVRGGSLVTERLHDAAPPSGLDGSTPTTALLLGLAFAVTFVVSVAASALGSGLALWGAGRVVQMTVGRRDGPARGRQLVR